MMKDIVGDEKADIVASYCLHSSSQSVRVFCRRRNNSDDKRAEPRSRQRMSTTAGINVISVSSLVRRLLTVTVLRSLLTAPRLFYQRLCGELPNSKTGKCKKKGIRKRKEKKKERGREGGEGFHSCC